MNVGSDRLLAQQDAGRDGVSYRAEALADEWLKLIDGHLRRDLDPDMEVDVEVLDVTEDEARKLLLTIDPLAALAEPGAAPDRGGIICFRGKLA